MKLHLGCGQKYLQGYTHVDLADYPHIDIRGDARKIPFNDNMAELIYASHIFEYFDRDEAVDVLKEWHRVLKAGGILRMAVPDFENIVKAYLKYGLDTKPGILGPMYGKWAVGQFENIYHKTIYDFDSLKKLLEANGFKDIRRWDWRKVLPYDYDDYSKSYLPHLNFTSGLLISLNMEATKI